MVGVVLLFFVGVGATLPALPQGVEDAGAGPVGLGVTLGVFPFAALAGRLVAGRSTDRLGRLVTLRVGLLVSAGAGVLLALPLPLWGLLAARTLHGLADAVVYVAAGAWVLDRVPEARRTVALSLLGSGIWGGYALGPLVGAALDLQQVGLVVVLVAGLAAALTLGLPDRLHDGPFATGLRALLPRGVAVPGVALGLGNLGYAAVVGFLVLQVDTRGGQGAVALTAFSVAVLAGRLVAVPLAVRLGILRTLPWGLVAMAGGLVVMAYAESTAVAAGAAVVVGVGYCLPFPALATLVAGRVPPAQHGAALGALTAFYDVFVGLGSVVFGLVAAGAGTREVFLLAAVGVLVAAAVDAGLARSEGQRRQVSVLASGVPDV